jgi:DNA-binding response OmpR family regulator
MIPKPTILIVDDQSDIHKNIKFAFEEEYTFLDAYSEKEMWDILEKNISALDLVILDLDLHNNKNYEAGFDIVKAVREKYQAVPIIILTSVEGTNKNQYKHKAIKNGANDFFYKGDYELKNWKIPLELLIAKKTLLFIDDDENFLDNIEFAFSLSAFNLILEKSYQNGLKQLRTGKKIDLILLDLDLGEGITSENLIKLKEDFSKTPIIIISNKQNGENLAKEADKFIYKGDYEPNEWVEIFYDTIKSYKITLQNIDEMTICEQLQEAIIDNDFIHALDLFKQKGVESDELIRLKSKWNDITAKHRKTLITEDTYDVKKNKFVYELLELRNQVCNSKNQENTNNQETSVKEINMNHKNQQLEKVEEGLQDCVETYGYHVKDFSEGGHAAKASAKRGMEDYNGRINFLEIELFNIASGISDDDKKELTINLKEARNPEATSEVKKSAKQKAIDLLKKYGPKVLEIGGKVALGLILRSIGLSLADIGLGD